MDTALLHVLGRLALSAAHISSSTYHTPPTPVAAAGPAEPAGARHV